MDVPVYPPSYHLVAAALPAPEQLGSSIIFAILDALITRKKVLSLKTLASKVIMESAIAERKGKRRSRMKACVGANECAAFARLIFGNSTTTSQFIMKYLPLKRIPVAPAAEKHIKIVIDPCQTYFVIFGTSMIRAGHSDDEIPLRRVLQLTRVILKMPFRLILFMIHDSVPHREQFIRKFNEFRENSKSKLKRLSTERANHKLYRFSE